MTTTTLADVYICAGLRTPFGRLGGALAGVRTDDLAALPIAALLAQHPALDPHAIGDVVLGCANQSGEDNRNVARMATLLAGLPFEVAATTINRLCGSGLDAIGCAARAIAAGDIGVAIAGGVESMSRAPYVMAKAATALARNQQLEDTTLGWRLVNPRMQQTYGTDSMTATAENLAAQHAISRADQDAFALQSQLRAARAQAAGRFHVEIVPVDAPAGKTTLRVSADEHLRPQVTLGDLAALPPLLGPNQSVTAGNAAGINDGAAAVLLADAASAARYGLSRRARVLGVAVAGVEPRTMGYGPVPAVAKLLARLQLPLGAFDVIEVNEAFAAQVLACTRAWNLPPDSERLNPNGGAIALGHPLGASGARLAITAIEELHRHDGRYALCAMCIGVGQGIALALERVT